MRIRGGDDCRSISRAKPVGNLSRSGGVEMIRAGIIIFFVITSWPALAQESGSPPSMPPWVFHWAITLVGLGFAVRFALQAFNRPAVPVADLPTFPRHMTNPLQYQFGSWIFVAFACGF